MAAQNSTKDSGNSWFGTVGAFIGAALGFDIGEWLGALIGLIAGAYVGLAVENILYKIMMLLAGLIIFLARREMLRGILDGLSS